MIHHPLLRANSIGYSAGSLTRTILHGLFACRIGMLLSLRCLVYSKKSGAGTGPVPVVCNYSRLT